MAKWIDETGLAHFWSKIKRFLDDRVTSVRASGSSSDFRKDLDGVVTIPLASVDEDGLMTREHVEKLRDLSGPPTDDMSKYLAYYTYRAQEMTAKVGPDDFTDGKRPICYMHPGDANITDAIQGGYGSMHSHFIMHPTTSGKPVCMDNAAYTLKYILVSRGTTHIQDLDHANTVDIDLTAYGYDAQLPRLGTSDNSCTVFVPNGRAEELRNLDPNWIDREIVEVDVSAWFG